MTQLTITAWQAIIVLMLAVTSGLLFGAAIVWRPYPEDPGPRHSPTPPGEQAPALPRAGLFPTTPLSLLSDHQAVMASDEAEIRRMTRQAENLYGRAGWES